MLGEKYTLDFRPTFIDELDRAAEYIEFNLQNPLAADKLVSDVYDAIDAALIAPLATAPVYREPDVAQPYYAIRVRNYTIYYIVRDHVMEIRWFRYSGSTRGLAANPVYDRSNPFDQ